MPDETAESSSSEVLENALANPQQISTPDAPSVAMRRAVTGVLMYCRNLARAIDDQDCDAVAEMASEAVNLWFAARRACRRFLAESERPSPLTQVAIEAIEDAYRKLVELFRHAIESIRVRRVAQTLADLRTGMDVARADPLINPSMAVMDHGHGEAINRCGRRR
ncbi:MAG: hypothetical protein ACREBE_09220 [bacterium]